MKSLRILDKCSMKVSTHYPLLRGMVSYSIIWPLSSITQEYLEFGKTLQNADWERAAHFGIFGAFGMAPFFYSWVKITNPFFKHQTLKTALTRAFIEQIFYAPIALSYFFFGMHIIEGGSIESSLAEARAKLWPAYKVGVFYWPTVQTINFYFMPEKNRVVFVSIASFIWTAFMAHLKSMKKHE